MLFVYPCLCSKIFIEKKNECINTCHLTLNPSKCKYLIASRRRQPHLPPTGLVIGNETLEQVDCYLYLGVLVTSKISWADHIEHICCKARRLVGILYRQFYAWADTSTMLRICHLHSSTLRVCMSLESPQKFAIACNVCLKQWDMNYESMLEQLDFTPLSQRQKLLKLITMYNIVNGTVYFPTKFELLKRYVAGH